MSDYQPKTGDRVRVVLEGDITGTDANRFLQIGVGASRTDWAVGNVMRVAVSIEKIEPPLPTTPGSVLRYANATGGFRYRLLRDDGKWVCSEKDHSPREMEPDEDVEVIFDAGAA